VLFILLTGYPPFEQAEKNDKWYKPLTQGDPAKFWKQHEGCGIKEDAKEVITKMLAYKPAERITLDQILESKFAQGEVHSTQELYHLLRKKHREATKRRMNDKKKMRELGDSIKKKRTLLFMKNEENEQVQRLQSSGTKQESQDADNAEKLESLYTREWLTKGSSCPVKKYQPRKSFMTMRWAVRPAYSKKALSEGEQKEAPIPDEVVEAYKLVMKALDVKEAFTVKYLPDGNPWELLCRAMVLEAKSLKDDPAGTHLSINKDHNGVYYFNFKRVGDPLQFNKYWNEVEPHFVFSEYLTDEIDEMPDEVEESEEEMKTEQDEYETVDLEELESQKVNAQNEIIESQEKRVDEDAKQEE